MLRDDGAAVTHYLFENVKEKKLNKRKKTKHVGWWEGGVQVKNIKYMHTCIEYKYR